MFVRLTVFVRHGARSCSVCKTDCVCQAWSYSVCKTGCVCQALSCSVCKTGCVCQAWSREL